MEPAARGTLRTLGSGEFVIELDSFPQGCANHQISSYRPMSASISRSEPASRRGHGPRGIMSASVLRDGFAIFFGRGCPTPDHKSKSNCRDSRRTSRTTIPVHFSTWAVVHRLLRTVQRRPTLTPRPIDWTTSGTHAPRYRRLKMFAPIEPSGAGTGRDGLWLGQCRGHQRERDPNQQWTKSRH